LILFVVFFMLFSLNNAISEKNMKEEFTPEPWNLGEYDETGGYDCMTGAIEIGPATLDGMNYGQKSCEPIDPAALLRMEADARLIAKACHLFRSLNDLVAFTAQFTDKGCTPREREIVEQMKLKGVRAEDLVKAAREVIQEVLWKKPQE